MAKKSGFLTDGQRQYLRGESNFKSDQAEQQTRYRIRKRAATALRDLAILERGLPTGSTDRRQTFETLFEYDLWKGYVDEDDMLEAGDEILVVPESVMSSLLRFLIAGFFERVPLWDVESNLEQWITPGVQQVMPGCYVDLTITEPDMLDRWVRELRDRQRNVRDAADAWPDVGETERQRRLTALVETSRLKFTEYEQAGGETPEGWVGI